MTLMEMEKIAIVTFKAVKSAYIMLAGSFFALALFGAYIVVHIHFQGRGITIGNIVGLMLLPFLVGCGFVIWLKGFKIEIDEMYLLYRDGMYKVHKIKLSDISHIKSSWIDIDYFFRKLNLPRLVISSKSDKVFIINDKPFQRNLVNDILTHLKN